VSNNEVSKFLGQNLKKKRWCATKKIPTRPWRFDCQNSPTYSSCEEYMVKFFFAMHLCLRVAFLQIYKNA
jgi:hypothetical protein